MADAAAFSGAGFRRSLVKEGKYLQPQTLGSVFANTYSSYFHNLVVIAGLATIVILPFHVMSVFLILHQSSLALPLEFFKFFIGFFIGPAIVVVIADCIQGNRPDIGRALRKGLTNYRLIGTVFVTALITVVGLLCLIVPGCVLGIRYAFVIPVCILEGRSFGSAMRRSRELVRGRAWRIFGIILIVYLPSYIFMYVTSFIVTFVMMATGEMDPAVLKQVAFPIGEILGGFLAPVVSIAYILLYFDARARMDGTGAVQLMEDIKL